MGRTPGVDPSDTTPRPATDGELLVGPDGSDLAAATALVEGLAHAPIAEGARPRLLAALRHEGRFERFAAELAAMIDLPLEGARALLDAVWTDPWEPGPAPGARTRWVGGGPAVQGCIRGFLTLPAGSPFPEHEHLGHEQVLVLQGHIVEGDGRVFGPGSLAEMPAGSRHAFHALAGGTDLLYFTVIREGVRVGDAELRHRDG